MDHAVVLRRPPLRFGRKRRAIVAWSPAWPDDALPFFLRWWLGATMLILLWLG